GVPRRQCGGKVVAKSASSAISGSVSSWSSAVARCVTPSAAAQRTSRSIAGIAASASGTGSLPSALTKSTWVATSQRSGPLTASSYELEAPARAESAPDLAGGPAVGEDDVRGEVVLAADQRGADTVGVDRDPAPRESLDLLHREAARRDDPNALEAVLVERVADLPDQTLVDAARVEVAELVPERPV